MATPYLDEAERCARVALLHDGRVMALDDPSALRARFDGVLFEVIVDAARPPVPLLAAIEGVRDVQVFGDGAHVRMDAAAPGQGAAAIERTLAAQGLRPLAVREVPASLEDVFIDLVTRASAPAAGA